MSKITWTESMTTDEYRGEVCEILRDQFLDPHLADEVAGKSHEWFEENFAGISPDRAAHHILDGLLEEE